MTTDKFSHLRLKLNLVGNISLIKNVGWMTASQALNKIFRLGLSIVLARLLMPEQFGMAALIFTVFELVSSIIRRSTQTSLINAPADELEQRCQKAYQLNWKICCCAFILQVALGYWVSRTYDNEALWLPICFLAINHLLLPLAMVQASLTIKQGHLAVVAKIDVIQCAADAFLTLGLLYAGFGLWALIIPKVLVTPIWIVIHRRHNVWRYKPGCLASFNTQTRKSAWLVMFADTALVLRNNLDYLLIGHFLGIEVLGIYYFAYNAGLGISNSIIQATGSAVLPHLCLANHSAQKIKQRFKQSLLLTTFCIMAITGLQSLMAEVYVPLVFGQRWVDLGAVPVLIYLCLSAIPRSLHDMASQLLRASNHLYLDFIGNALVAILMLMAIVIGVQYDITQVALCIFLSLCISTPIFLYFAYRRVFFNQNNSHQFKHKFISNEVTP